MPVFQEALESGRVSAEHVDAVAGLVRGLDEPAVAEVSELAEALVESAAAIESCRVTRACRLAQLRQQRYVRRWVDRQTGMCKTLISLDPETDAKVWTAINGAVGAERANPQDRDTTWGHLVTDTVVDLFTGARAVNDRVPEVSLLIDLETLQNGLHDGSVCETSDGAPLPPETVRRMGCDGDVLPVVLGGKAEVLDVGRARRLATRPQRTALKSMYRTCAHPDCQVPFDACRIHHVDPWEHGGVTNLDKLLPLCEREQHHLVHEGGWQLTLQPDRRITLRRPDGTVYFEGSTVDRESRAPPGTATA